MTRELLRACFYSSQNSYAFKLLQLDISIWAFEKFPFSRWTQNQNNWFSPTLFAKATWIYILWVPVCCKWPFFIAHKDNERSLSSTRPVLNMKKLHSHFCALLKQLLSYAFEKRASLYRLKALGHKTALPFYRGAVVERNVLSWVPWILFFLLFVCPVCLLRRAKYKLLKCRLNASCEPFPAYYHSSTDYRIWQVNKSLVLTFITCQCVCFMG